MSRWHIWGDYVHVVPDRIGTAQRILGESNAAEATAKASGWNVDYRTRNGFEPWAEAFETESDEDFEFELKRQGNVRGWHQIR